VTRLTKLIAWRQHPSSITHCRFRL